MRRDETRRQSLKDTAPSGAAAAATRITDRFLLAAFTCVVALSASAQGGQAQPGPGGRPLIGAIRWDAWSGGPTTRHVEKTLGPKQYHWRLPWYAEVLDDHTVRIHGGRQDIMDREIRYAAEAGIDYWAFVLYAEDSDLTTALKLYLRSRQTRRVGFCMLLHHPIAAPDAQWPSVLRRYVRLMKDPRYQTVLDGRPLIYLYRPSLRGKSYARRFAAIRRAARDAGLGNPYLAYMGWRPAADWRTARELGFDAVSAYAFGGAQGGRYQDLAAQVETAQWQTCRRLGIPVIPLVQTGWDKRPRMDNPVPWERGAAYHKARRHFEPPTPAQLAAHLGRALDWVERNRALCPARSVIVYAWNENDEGGWLVPTRGPLGEPNTERLDAINALLARRRNAAAQREP